MAGSLEGPLSKWRRAERQLESLDTEIEQVYPAHKVWPVHAEADGAGLEYRFYLGELPSVEPEFVVGEILFDLRSALDHLAYQLHDRHFRGRVPERVERTSQFPIYDTPDGWTQALWRIENLSERDHVALHHLQPYETRDGKWHWHRWALSRLNAWHNWDKHRKLHLITASKEAAIITKPGPAFRTSVRYIHGPMKSEAEIERWTSAGRPRRRSTIRERSFM
jgi:hypothetical protein